MSVHVYTQVPWGASGGDRTGCGSLSFRHIDSGLHLVARLSSSAFTCCATSPPWSSLLQHFLVYFFLFAALRIAPRPPKHSRPALYHWSRALNLFFSSIKFRDRASLGCPDWSSTYMPTSAAYVPETAGLHHQAWLQTIVLMNYTSLRLHRVTDKHTYIQRRH